MKIASTSINIETKCIGSVVKNGGRELEQKRDLCVVRGRILEEEASASPPPPKKKSAHGRGGTDDNLCDEEFHLRFGCFGEIFKILFLRNASPNLKGS